MSNEMSNERKMQIFNFLSKFILRGDKGSHMYKLVKQLGMMKKPNGVDDYTNAHFYIWLKDMKKRLESRSHIRELQYAFNDMWPIYNPEYIREKLNLTMGQYTRLLTRYRNMKYNGILLEKNTTFSTVHVSIPDVILKRMLIEHGSTNEIIESALRDYFRMPGGQNEQ